MKWAAEWTEYMAQILYKDVCVFHTSLTNGAK